MRNRDHYKIPLSSISAPLSSLHDPYISVGVSLQTEHYQQVTDILSACRFRLKSEDKPNKNPADIPMFRNLFFPCPEEIDEFE